MKRSYDRKSNQLRPLHLTYNTFGYAAGSVLFEMGRTKVLCAVNLQYYVPPFLKGKKTGWLTAEYSMLPTSTHRRIEREVSGFKRNGRFIEISRLIGRALRSVIRLDLLGERTIIIDCDVLQADGSTRTACISGAFFALREAVNKWLAKGILEENIIVDELAAVSVGISQKKALLDLDFSEDSTIDADFNFVLTRSGTIIEIQGTAECYPVSWQEFEQLKKLASKGIDDILSFVDERKSKARPFNSIRINPNKLEKAVRQKKESSS